MTDRKLTCVACKSAITEGDIAHSDLEFGGEIKATDQPTYTADMDTDFIATVGMLDEYAPMVRTTGNQTIAGAKTFTGAIISLRAANHFVAQETINTIANGDTFTRNIIVCNDADGVEISTLRVTLSASGIGKIDIRVRNSDGTYKTVVLGEGDTI